MQMFTSFSILFTTLELLMDGMNAEGPANEVATPLANECIQIKF